MILSGRSGSLLCPYLLNSEFTQANSPIALALNKTGRKPRLYI